MNAQRQHVTPISKAGPCCDSSMAQFVVHVARTMLLVVMAWVAGHCPAGAQVQRQFPIDVTDDAPQEQSSQAALYRPQAWQTHSTAPFAVQQASFHVPAAEPADVPPPTAAPFISLTANESTASGNSQTGDDIVGDGFLIQLGTWTVIVLCLCVLTILGIRHWQRSRGMLPAGVQSGRVLDTLVLGPGRSISLIQIQGLRALVGCDATGIRTIAMASPDFDDAYTSALGDEQPKRAASEPEGNSGHLNR